MSEGRRTPPMPELPIHRQNEECGDGISMMSNGNDSESLNLQTGGGSIVTTVSTQELLDKESKMNKNEIDAYLINLYQTLEAEKYNMETLSTVSGIVRNNIVRKVKFIDNEQTTGLSREAVEESRKYPSFWKPDLSLQKSIQNDIMNEFPLLRKATLHKKVQAWMGMREKVKEAIRGHRNHVNTAIQNSIVTGKNFSEVMTNNYLTKVPHQR